MKTFLEFVAEDIIKRFGNNLANVTVVFPNKRASLFLNEALMKYSDRPVLAPRYLTISELFTNSTDLRVGDRIRLVCILYKVYVKITESDESLDRFFPWGEIIINDFEDIDKHLLSAHEIFTNVKELHELDDISFLTDEQRQVLKQFFPDYEGNNTHLKEKFLKLWSKLADIYDAFKQACRDANAMYEGALYREVVVSSPPLSPQRRMKGSDHSPLGEQGEDFIFVGFNHLLPVEEKLFKCLKAATDTLFYWDYDASYINGHEAGEDIKRNMVFFPNAFGNDEAIYDNFKHKKDITIVTASTNNLQARYVHDWLCEGNRWKDGHKTVIVLADESLLPSVIHSLPKEADKANITIGYNLSFTNIPLMINKLMSEAKYRNMPTLTEKLVYLSDKIQEEARQEESSALEKESLFRTFTLLNRLRQLTESGELNVSETTLNRLIMQLLFSTSVPFHGEPIEGIQIMGVLETRNLDFDHILMLSCNEGTMPKASESTSFIPYFLRKAHGLTTIDTKADIFAYYFYRLLQRCGDISLTWNKSTEGMLRGEMSRFMLQLMVEASKHDIKHITLHTGQSTSTSICEEVEKTDEVMEALHRRFANIISPTAIATYLRCQKRFYYHYVLQLQEYEDPEETEQDNRTFGNIFHNAVHELYNQFVGRDVTATAIENINKRDYIRQVVVNCYLQELSKNTPLPDGFKFDGLQTIKIDVIAGYIKRLLDIDKRRTPFKLIALEKEYTTDLTIKSSMGAFTVKVGGIVDRLDSKNGEVRVVDYKTGGSKFEPRLSTVVDIFEPAMIKYHSDYYLQTFLYSSIVNEQMPSEKVFPALLFIQHATAEDYSPILRLKGKDAMPISAYQSEFIDKLHDLLDDIFNPKQPFTPIANADTTQSCSFCPFKRLCLKQ